MNDGDRKYENACQQRTLKLILALSRRVADGVAPKELADALNVTAATIHRDLANLRLGGFAEMIEPTGRWRLAPRVAQVAVDVMNDLDRAQRQLAETVNRFTRTQQ